MKLRPTNWTSFNFFLAKGEEFSYGFRGCILHQRWAWWLRNPGCRGEGVQPAFSGSQVAGCCSHVQMDLAACSLYCFCCDVLWREAGGRESSLGGCHTGWCGMGLLLPQAASLTYAMDWWGNVQGTKAESTGTVPQGRGSTGLSLLEKIGWAN